MKVHCVMVKFDPCLVCSCCAQVTDHLWGIYVDHDLAFAALEELVRDSEDPSAAMWSDGTVIMNDRTYSIEEYKVISS